MQRYDPPREVFVATDKGVKKIAMELAEWTMAGGTMKMFIKGKLWQARSGTWTMHARERRAIGDRVYSTRKEAVAVYQAYRSRIVESAKKRLDQARQDMRRVTSKPTE